MIIGISFKVKKKTRRISISLLLVVPFLLLLQDCSLLSHIRGKKPHQISLEIVDKIHIAKSEFLRRDFGSYFFNDDGSFYYADHISKKITVFTATGSEVITFGKRGGDDGEFNAITDIDLLDNGNIMVVDAVSQRISEFGLNGEFIKNIVDFDMGSYHVRLTSVIVDSANMADVSKYFVFNENTTFFLSPYCDAQVVDGRYIYLAGHEQGPYYRDDIGNLSLLRKFYFPELAQVSKGGNYSKVYRRSIRPLQRYDFSCVDDQVYIVEANSPHITHLNEHLDFEEVVYHEGSGFHPIPEDFKEEIFLKDDLAPLFQYIVGCSMMQRIFEQGDFTVALYVNVGNFENFLKEAYLHHYYNYQKYTEQFDFSEIRGDEDEHWLQVLSRDLKEFYGDIQLPNKLLGYNRNFIFFAGNPNHSLQKNTILKCRLKLRQ